MVFTSDADDRSIRTANGTYSWIPRQLQTLEITHLHFAIECNCGSMDGSRYKDISTVEKECSDFYVPSNQKSEYTYYMNEEIFRQLLELRRVVDKNESPLVIICNGCDNEFSFTQGSYEELHKKIWSGD